MATTFMAVLTLALISEAASPPQQPGCVAELVAFSPCLPYVSAPPNNFATTVDPQCCDSFSSAFSSGDGYCLCYLLRQPMVLGFPLNESRLASLPSLCLEKNSSSPKSLCSSDGDPDDGSSPLVDVPPESANASSSSFPPDSGRSPTPPGWSDKPASVSSATKWNHSRNSWFFYAIVIFLHIGFCTKIDYK